LVNKTWEEINKYCFLESQKDMQFKNIDKIYLEKCKEIIRKYNIEIINFKKYVTLKDFQDMVYLALNKIPPFEEKDKGFRDCTILKSYMNYIKTNKKNDQANYLFSDDKIFRKSESLELMKDSNLKVINDIVSIFDIDENSVKKYTECIDYIRSKILDDYTSLSDRIINIYNDEYQYNEYGGYNEASECIVDDISFKYYYEDDEHVYFSATFNCRLSGICYGYNSVRDPREDIHFPLCGFKAVYIPRFDIDIEKEHIDDETKDFNSLVSSIEFDDIYDVKISYNMSNY
jgi:hypothetical protein